MVPLEPSTSGVVDVALTPPLYVNNIVITMEPIHLATMKECIEIVGERTIPASEDGWTKSTEGRTVEEVLQPYLQRAQTTQGEVGWIYSGWKQPQFAANLGIKGRYNSGVTLEQIPQEHPMYEITHRLMALGYTQYQATCSPFSLSRLLKSVSRLSCKLFK